MGDRRIYFRRIWVNGRFVNRVIIDPHYEVRHGPEIGDDLILRLVSGLDGIDWRFDSQDGGFSYFVTDLPNLKFIYRLIWLLPHEGDFIGVVNAFRRR